MTVKIEPLPMGEECSNWDCPNIVGEGWFSFVEVRPVEKIVIEQTRRPVVRLLLCGPCAESFRDGVEQ